MVKKFVRKVMRVGQQSLFINLPVEFVRELKIREKQELVVYKRGSKIIVEDSKKE